MSTAQISDIELDRLLGEVPTPPPPAANLADRIAARALRTPQDRTQRFAKFRRQGPRRRAALWTAVVAANLMAAAAAAASWDGQAFDFHRLTELPHRVAAAIHIGHHHPPKKLAAPRTPRPAAPGPMAQRAVVKAPVVAAHAAPEREPAAATVMPRIHRHQRILASPVEAPRVIEPRKLRVQQASRFHAFQHRVAIAPERIARVRAPEPLERATPTLLPPSRENAWESARGQERAERNAAAAERRQEAREVNAPLSPATNIPLPQTTPQNVDRRQMEAGRRRFGWWQKQIMRREHPRETRRRFGRRF